LTELDIEGGEGLQEYKEMDEEEEEEDDLVDSLFPSYVLYFLIYKNIPMLEPSQKQTRTKQ
jgi:hypothetical protein